MIPSRVHDRHPWSPGARDPLFEVRVVWFEHADSTTLAPWAVALVGLVVLVWWLVV